jgi:hypothetical protein
VLALALAAAVLAVLPPAAGQSGGPADGAGSVDVPFYGHVFTHTASRPAPANVEYPTGEANYGRGTLHECFRGGEVVPLEQEANTEHDCEDSYINSLVLYSTAGFVDVNDREEFLNNGMYSQLHNERGQAKPVLLDTDGTVTANIHMTVDLHGWADGDGETFCVLPHPENVPCAYPYWGWDPGAQPDYQVEATLYSAELGPYKGEAARRPPIEETLRDGNPTVVAHGQTEPELAMDGIPTTPRVLEFEVDLGQPQVDRIPKTHDFFLVYKFHSNSSGEKYGIHSWRIWAGEFYPPSFSVPVENAFAVESVIPRFVHDKLAVVGVMGSPWGSYDIDPEATHLTIQEAETGATVEPEAIEAFADYSVAHGGHFDPANVSYVWDYKKDDLEPGTYEATITAENYQNTVTASCTGTFTVGPNGQPRGTQPGSCGFQSLTEEQRRRLQADADEQADDGSRLSQPDPRPGAAASALTGLVLGAIRIRRP